LSPETKSALSAEPNCDALEPAADVARVGFWNWDLVSGQLILDSRSAATHRVPRTVEAESFLAKAIHPDDLAAFRAALSHAMSSPHPASQHVRLLGQGGTIRLVDLRMKVHHDAAGQAVRLVTAVADIVCEESREALFARHAEAERSLAERLSVATQAAGVYMWEFDWTEFKVRWDDNRLTGRAGTRHFGRELGDDFLNWVHPDDRYLGATAMQEAFDRGESDSSFRYRLNLPDGTTRHIQAYARTYMGPNGKPLRSLGVSWDVTSEVLAAEELAGRTSSAPASGASNARCSLQPSHMQVTTLRWPPADARRS
jgi:PAS domain-containing protein